MNLAQSKYAPYLACVLLAALATVAGEFVKTRIEPTNIVMIYLLIVVIAAVRWGRGPAAFASVVGVLAFDYFLVPPYLTFDVAHAHYILTFAGLLATGLVIGSLASRMREQTIEANRREAQTAALHRLSADLAAADAMSPVLAAVVSNVSAIFDCSVGVFLPSGGSLVRAAADPDFPTTQGGRLAAARAFAERAPVDSTGGDPARGVTRYLPLDTPQGAER